MSEFAQASTLTRICHFGVGRFHRAHEALYIHELITDYDATDWAICGVCMLPFDEPMFETLQTQRGVYTLVERDNDGERVVRVNSIKEVLFGYKYPQKVFDKLSSTVNIKSIAGMGDKSGGGDDAEVDEVQVVTITVTEAGYFFDPSTKRLDFSHPAILHDLQNNASSPKTIYGYLVYALYLRYVHHIVPFTVQSCDNIQGNGELMKALLLEFCRHDQLVLSNPDTQVIVDSRERAGFLAWLDEQVCFPNSMVDRITPAASPSEVAYVKEVLNFADDRVPVTCEKYRQWVIEDIFSGGSQRRPPFERFPASAGVSLVADVKPYEKMKVRLLNAGHSALGYAGYLAGFTTIDAVASDPLFQSYLRRFFQEVEVTLDPLPDVDFRAYQASLISRFSNRNIKDDILRICKDGSAKIPGFILPTLQDVVALIQTSTATSNRSSSSSVLSYTCLCFVVASWIAFVVRAATVPQEQPDQRLLLDDPERQRLMALVQQGTSAGGASSVGDVGCMAHAFMSDRRLFGDLIDNTALVSLVQQHYRCITTQGVLVAVQQLQLI